MAKLKLYLDNILLPHFQLLPLYIITLLLDILIKTYPCTVTYKQSHHGAVKFSSLTGQKMVFNFL